MNLFLLCILLFAAVYARPQVPYDYIPIGRKSETPTQHAHDVNLNYERLFPSRRKMVQAHDLPSRRNFFQPEDNF